VGGNSVKVRCFNSSQPNVPSTPRMHGPCTRLLASYTSQRPKSDTSLQQHKGHVGKRGWEGMGGKNMRVRPRALQQGHKRRT
jgi:hypothetical protein